MNMNGLCIRIFLGIFVLNLTLMAAAESPGGHDKLNCTVCHKTVDGKVIPETHIGPAQSPNSLCLACHDAGLDRSGLLPPHVLNGSQDLAGGSFTSTMQSDKTGHNILWIDETLGTTPPGGYAVDPLTCLSCHDPHNNGNFRNLKKQINGYFTPVQGVGDPQYRENFYLSGMNEFCCACHQQFHGTGQTGRGGGWSLHPVGIRIYGARHADFDHWDRLEDKLTASQNPTANPSDAEVFCLTCHRAHATPWPDSMRWDYSRNPQGCLECHTF
jgi:predicted CXXCH cytochrome family protein